MTSLVLLADLIISLSREPTNFQLTGSIQIQRVYYRSWKKKNLWTTAMTNHGIVKQLLSFWPTWMSSASYLNWHIHLTTPFRTLILTGNSQLPQPTTIPPITYAHIRFLRVWQLRFLAVPPYISWNNCPFPHLTSCNATHLQSGTWCSHKYLDATARFLRWIQNQVPNSRCIGPSTHPIAHKCLYHFLIS